MYFTSSPAVRLYTALLTLAVAACAAGTQQMLPRQGYVLTTYAPNDYLTPASDASLSKMASIGVRVVEIVVTWYMDSCLNSTRITQDPDSSPTDASVTHAIQTAHKLGMAVALKPHVDCHDGVWRGEIGSKYTTEGMWTDWWSNYTAFITHFSTLATANNVEFLNVGTELDSTEFRVADWRAVIAAVRVTYSAPIWYGCNWNPGPWAVQFWDALDFIGVDAYYPLAMHQDPNVTEIVAAWQPVIANVSALSAKWGKPIIFAEIGYASFSDAALQPWQCCSGLPDLQTQANLYQGFFASVWQQPWFAAVFWWAWTATDDIGSRCSTDFDINAKPAEVVVATAYGGNASTRLRAQQLHTDAQPQLPVYADGATSFADWSYSAQVNMKNSTGAFPGHAFSLSANVQPNGAVVFRSAGVDVSAFDTLDFDITLSNANLSVYVSAFLCACDSCSGCATQLPTVQAVDYTSSESCLLPTGWGHTGHVSIPISALTGGNASLAQSIHRISIGFDADAANNLDLQLDNMVFQ